MVKTKLGTLLSVVISAQIGFGSALAGTAAPSPNLASLPPVDADPLFQSFKENPSSPLKLSFDAQDPALDQDPFFLRSQSWISSEKMGELSFRKNNGALELALPGMGRALRLQLSMTPVQTTDEFVFLSVDANSDLFRRAAGEDRAGEGLFVLSRAELLRHAVSQEPLPLFFLPLPGTGWTGPVDAVELHETETLALANHDGTAIALELKDVATMIKAQQMNLLLATTLTAKIRGLGNASRLLPAAGMTAAFGLFFTGIDRENPTKSYWGATPDVGSNFSLPSSFAWVKSLLAPSRAEAIELSQDVVHRLVFVGSVLTGMLALSFVLKYAHPGVWAKLRGHEGPVPSFAGRLRESFHGGIDAKRELRETFDVFAHVTTTSAQFASVTFGNALELFLDRFAPSVAAADHTLVRRFLKKTFYFARDSVKNAPVNSKTFLLGSVVMGGVDTAFVVVQYEVAVPWLCQAASPLLSPAWQVKVDQTFDPANPNTANLVVQDSVRTGLAYAQNGASSYSMESRAQVLDTAVKEADAFMRSQGKDPSEPQNQAERQNLIEAKVDQALKQRGLPGKDQFLFDASSLFQSVATAQGFKAPEELQKKESFILAKRFGLSENALRRAVDVARSQALADGSRESREVVMILEETLNKMSFVRGSVAQGLEGVREARLVRQQLTLLSYEGPVDWAVRYVPESWQARFSPEAAVTAGLIFRQSLYSYLSTEGDSLLKTSKTRAEEFGADGRKAALAAVQKTHPELALLTGAELEARAQKDHLLELRQRTQLEINRLAREQAAEIKATGYQSPKVDWLERRQRTRAETKANERLAAAMIANGQSLSPEQGERLFRDFYRDEMARQVGLHLESSDQARASNRGDYVQMIAAVEQHAEETTRNQIANDRGLSEYLAKVGAAEHRKIEAALYANNYLQAYKTAATDEQMISPLDYQAPGRFQKIRRSAWVRDNAFLTRSVRAAESLMNDQAIKPGWRDAFGRNIPLFDDLWSSHLRVVRTFLPNMTVVYLWNYFAWQVHIPYATAALFQMVAPATILTPSMWLTRAFRMNNLKAMDSVMSKVLYAIPYAWVTFGGMIPLTLLSPDMNRFFADSIRDPILSVIGQVPPEAWLATALAAGTAAIASNRNVRENVARGTTVYRCDALGTW